MNHNAYIRFDTRLDPKNWIANQREYKTNTKFSSIQTSLSGGMAVGSFDGKIRLFKDSSANKAMNLYPGLGDPITSIDVT